MGRRKKDHSWLIADIIEFIIDLIFDIFFD